MTVFDWLQLIAAFVAVVAIVGIVRWLAVGFKTTNRRL